MLTLHTTPESAPVLRLLIATMRDLCEQENYYDMTELLHQAELACAASGLDLDNVQPIVLAIRDRKPICTVGIEAGGSGFGLNTDNRR
jgi:hypothetical protein